MAVINTNITALIGQQNLGKSQSSLQTSMERLSSGLRINSAADDAAGQAIANRMSSQITGLSQAQRNANDGISVAQTAEGALNQVNDNLQRIRELTVQAQNGTNSADDLSSIQDEIGQRLEEIDRISEETSFNGVKVLASDDSLTIQVGANDGETITLDLQKINSETLELDTFNVAPGIDTADVGDATTSMRIGDDVALDSSGFDATAAGNGTFGDFSVDESGQYYIEVTGGTAAGYYEVTVDDAGAATLGGLATDQPGPADLTTVTTVKESVDLTGDDADKVYAYNGTEAGAPEYVIQDTDADSNNVYFKAEVDADGAVTRGEALSTEEATADPLKALDSALSTVDSLRSELGAMQNRFDSAITNLSTTTTNLSAARSRIEDADYAVEVSNMTRSQILQQAGTSVLAQANQVPQSVLSLLG
ncbi:flagellin FliC [Alcanivorax sp. N3-2A]|nr:flagellin FliC [Alcanivorax sp. N3-2A]|tara:strand:- start:128 stop:1393 length:1266 start_codon:yes stop_codon:yes gene_type:complete